MRSLLLATAALGLSGALATAHADLISIGLQQAGTNSGNITTVATGNGSAGVVSLSYGTFTVNNISGTGTPPNPEPDLLSNSINVSNSSAASMNIFITEQGLSTPTGINKFLSTFTANDFLGNVISVVEKTFISTSNALYTGTPLDSETFTSIGTATSIDATPSLAAPYSETAEFIVTVGAGGGSVNDTINISKVPEPASLAVLGLGLLGLGVVRRRRA